MALVYIPDVVMAKVIATGTDKQAFVKDAITEKLHPRKAAAVESAPIEPMKTAKIDKYGKAMISRTLAGKTIEYREVKE